MPCLFKCLVSVNPELNMTTSKNPDQDLLLQQDILRDRPFSLAEAIGREGGTFLKGESTVPKLVQVITEIIAFLKMVRYSNRNEKTNRECLD